MVTGYLSGPDNDKQTNDNYRCRFPGCHNHRFLQCHHVEHWSRNGETSLDNLMLCTKHHTLIHEGGFRIETDFQDNWYFVRPDGIAVPEAGYHCGQPLRWTIHNLDILNTLRGDFDEARRRARQLAEMEGFDPAADLARIDAVENPAL